MEEPDEVLWARAHRGDEAAFDRLYARYEHRVFGFLVRLLHGDRVVAEEVFHDTFLRVLDGRHLEPRGALSFSAWLFRVARNLASNQLRKRRRGLHALERLSATETFEPTPEEHLGERERASALARAVESLPQGLADVFHLRTSGLSYEEIAGVLELPLGTVKSRLNTLVQQLRGVLT